MIEDAEEDVAIAEGQLAEALGEKATAAHRRQDEIARDLQREEPLPAAPVVAQPAPAPENVAASRWQPAASRMEYRLAR